MDDQSGPDDPFLQPYLHDLLACLAAPTQAWSGTDGQVRPEGAQGVFHGDVRVLSTAVLRVSGEEPAPLLGVARTTATAHFVGVVRHLGDRVPDPTVRVERHRTVTPGSVVEEVALVSTAQGPVDAVLDLTVGCDLAAMDEVKAGAKTQERAPDVTNHDGFVWTDGTSTATLRAAGARVDPSGRLTWTVRLPPGDRAEVSWSLTAEEADPLVATPRAARSWSAPSVIAEDPRLAALLDRSLDDLAGLRLVARRGRHGPSDLASTDGPDAEQVFIGAGAPWFLTLFGRDALWAARMLLPLGTELAHSTLRALASRQGTKSVTRTAEQPGKILHEVRRGEFSFEPWREPDDVLPPVYYGTIDATPLWVCLLHDAWRWGLGADAVEQLLPHLEAALTWVVEHGDADGDGFLEYVDTSGRGLANQGWKDSGDSVQWHDGRLAEAPLALCEVQGYAYEALQGGARLLEAFGRGGADRWRASAARLRAAFRDAFWVDDPAGRFPAIALDGHKRRVDSLTSNIGHLLGTGLLDDAEEDAVTRRLCGPDMLSGYGIRTLSADAGGYTPLGYHAGSVWPHDTAIVLRGLARTGRTVEASALVDGLLAAGSAFGGRLPELFGGATRHSLGAPLPYPAACRPQAWSAASSVAVLAALLGLQADVPGGTLEVGPLRPCPVGALSVRGLRVAGEELALTLDRDGAVTSMHPPTGLEVRVAGRAGTVG